MLEEEVYNEALQSLEERLKDTSDSINAEAREYKYYLTKTGVQDERKEGFNVRFIITFYSLSTQRFCQIAEQLFSKINLWIEDYKNIIHFYNFDMKTVTGGDNQRFEIKVYFDDKLNSVKKLLLR